MALPNGAWARVMLSAAENIDNLKSPDAIREVSRILRTNARVCKQVGPGFASQMARIFLEVLNVYKAFSGFISSSITLGGEAAMRTSLTKIMKGAKQEVLCLIETFIQRSTNPKFVAEQFMTLLMEPILDDYARSIPAARNTEVLSLITTAVNKLREHMAPHVPRVMGALFGSTLEMIKVDFKEHPETRLNFYKMLRALVKHNFQAVFSLSPETQKATVDSFLWAIKHPQRDIADLGLSALHNLFEHVASNPAIAQPFYKQYLTVILTDLLYALTDRLHKSAFKMHCVMLRSICRLVERGQVAVPLFPDGKPDMNNQRYLREFIGNLVLTTFPHLSQCVLCRFGGGGGGCRCRCVARGALTGLFVCLFVCFSCAARK